MILTAALFSPGNVASVRTGHVDSAEAAAASAKVTSSSLLHSNYAREANSLRHWEKPVVNVFVDTSGESSRSDLSTRGLVLQGMALWNAKIGNAVRLQAIDCAHGADVVVSFVEDGRLEGGAIGRTDVVFRLDDQVLTHATVRIEEGMPAAELVQVSAHELGHALGIQGHSPDRNDLMYPYAHLPAAITDRDRNTMAVSYSLPRQSGPGETGMPAAAAEPASAAGSSTESDTAAEFALPTR